MSRFKFRRPSPALVISLIAMFVALGSGAYAATKIGTSDLKNKAVTSKKLDKKAAKASKIAKDAVKKNKIASEAVTTGKIADLGVSNSKLLSPTIWAYISGGATPSITRSNVDSETGAGATAVSRVNAGNYRVTFQPQDPSLDGISGCLPLAVASDVGDERTAQADLDVTDNTQVFVRTRDTISGDSADSAFNIALFC